MWAAGGTVFAGVLMLVDGVLGVLGGIAGIARDDVYAAIGDYLFRFDPVTWGWIHLSLGVLSVAVGWGVLAGAAWARAVGVALAAAVVVVNVGWLPYQPAWAVITVAIGLFVIWSLCTDRPAARRRR
ncbi:integral membrane protein [Streptantibioticus cattleyicolor NRRL 8057 = DSM 46488]|uniref:Integral membrane protein n=1 Tax=Streptantibioticus cattleyicolor (strain ATCC 35852 / DSM 46488 / JCM 4925 / NBRC 14057 / NRRL 8057) TaxID=1003195 RepID=G8X3K2_STREN|nr:integral membrane protein [Streptantibioticus cattleyicolor NRRL 8057 = DSM 46488]